MEWGGSQDFFGLIGVEKKPPEIPIRLVPYWHAFLDLHAQRQFGESGPQPLSFQEIAAFLLLDGSWVPRIARGFFSRFVRRLDAVYMEHVSNKQRARLKQLREKQHG